jgi:hypothetical protein
MLMGMRLMNGKLARQRQRQALRDLRRQLRETSRQHPRVIDSIIEKISAKALGPVLECERDKTPGKSDCENAAHPE